MYKIFLMMFLSSALLFAASPDSSMSDFTLNDYDGNEVTLSELAEDSEAVAVMFIATQCPVSNNYNERMAELYNEYKDQDVTVVGVNSNKQESAEEVKEHAAEKGLEFTIVKDPNNVVADEYGASVTPEIYLLDNELNLLYHGRIDDNQRENEVTVNDLRNALDEVLAGDEVSVAKTKAFGCTIKRVDK